MNDPKSEKAHAHDCAIAINARHGCTCEGAPETVENIKADIVKGSYITLSKEYEKLEAENAALRARLDYVSDKRIEQGNITSKMAKKIADADLLYYGLKQQLTAAQARADAAEAACATLQDCVFAIRNIHLTGSKTNSLGHDIDHYAAIALKAVAEKKKEPTPPPSETIFHDPQCSKSLDSQMNCTCKPQLPPELVEAKYAKGGDFYDGIEWLGCWLLDHTEGETITEEALRPWCVEALKAAVEAHRKGGKA